jgi:hypothetical protein
MKEHCPGDCDTIERIFSATAAPERKAECGFVDGATNSRFACLRAA